MAKTLKPTIYILLLPTLLTCANSARLLDEVEPQPQVMNPALTTVPITPTGLPSGQIPATGPNGTADQHAELDQSIPKPEASPTTEAPSADAAAPSADVEVPTAPIEDAAPVPPLPLAATSSPTVPAPTTVVKPGPHEPTLSFFVHDIIGGSHPSARVVTGIVANSEISGIPFSKPNSNIFPIQGATPLLNGGVNNIKGINNLVNNPSNLPLLTGLTGSQAATIIQSAGNGNNVQNGQSQPFVTAGQLPVGSLQRLMFGSITVIDDQLTETHELDSPVMGKAQGFYLASSLDGTSHTFALTVLIHGEHHDEHGVDDTISFFGVHRTASAESQVAVVGGTGKYEDARGYATVETTHKEDQHTTDGVDTILHVNVYLTE